MPASLRKACHACTAAKRRCAPRLPKCARCSEKGLSCTYDLEPVTNVEAFKQAQPASHWEPLPPVVFDSIASAQHAVIQGYRPNGGDDPQGLPLMANPETFALVAERLKTIPLLTFQHRSTPFVHAQVLRTENRDHATTPGTLAAEISSERDLTRDVLESEQQQLLSLNIHQLTFTGFLAAFHRLTAILLSPVLGQDQGVAPPTLSEPLVDLCSKWIQHFYTILPRTLSTNLSAWQAWVIAESSRRTLIFIAFVEAVLEIMRTGYCRYRPMLESLPFDARTGLWEANTEEEWQAAVANHGGSECSLMSWAEFTERGEGPAPRQEHDGVLQRILLLCYYGKAAAEFQSDS